MLDQLRAETAGVVMGELGVTAHFTPKVGDPLPAIRVRIHKDMVPVDDYGTLGQSVEVGILITDVPRAKPDDVVTVAAGQADAGTYTIQRFVRQVGNIRRYQVV